MLKPVKPENEDSRLVFLKSLNILDAAPNEELDALTQKAREYFDVPISLVSIVDASRQWFMSCNGLSADETSRDISFCGHAINTDSVFFIPDTLSDLRFIDTPLVTGEPHIRFYAGHQIVIDGHAIGTFCIIDTKPRSFSRSELNQLAILSEQAKDIIVKYKE